MTGLDDLIQKTNTYTQLIHKSQEHSKVVSMAPANSLQNMEYDENWGKNNSVQLKRLIKETDTDIVGIHCYISSTKHRYNFKKLMNNVNQWVKDSNKKIWITETGTEDWNQHVDFYYEWTSRFSEYLKAQKILWYRQTSKLESDLDSGFALEIQNPQRYSPLWIKIQNKT